MCPDRGAASTLARLGAGIALAAIAGVATGCGDDGGTARPVWPPAPTLDAPAVTSIVELENLRGELGFGVLAVPTAAGPHPAVIVLHGSGGLFRLPAAGDAGTCSPQLESQFVRWAERLVGLGFIVLLPDSFTPRGFCDANDDPRRATAFPPIAADDDGAERQLLARIYDVDAATRFLAASSGVRSDAIAMLGFSNGASTTALYAHHRLSAALDELAADADGQALGVELPRLAVPAPALRQAIAYYPGCGFNGVLPFSTDLANVDTFYYPAAPLRVEHGSADPLVEHCSITAAGTRERQADSYAAQKAVTDHFDIRVHADAEHGFDAAGCDNAPDTADANTLACRDALATTLSLLEPLRAP